MQQRIFGKTGEKVSLLGFGCMRLPLSGPGSADIDYPLATAMLRKAIEGGVNYVDTAHPYHSPGTYREAGESEVLVGHALADGWREKVHLATKLPNWMVSSKKEMHDLLDFQLRRLQTDHIDFYLAHSMKASSWPAMKAMGMLEFFDEARRDGRIRHAGFSFHDRFEVFADVLQGYDWEVAQIQYNYLDVDYQAGRRGAELAKARGVGLIVMEPLRGGFLINHLPKDLRKVLEGVRPHWSMADWGFRWLYNRPEVDLVLSGMSTMEQVEQNLAIAANPGTMSEADFAAADSVRKMLEERLPTACTGCGYCLPCPAGVNIPTVLSSYNDYALMDAEDVKKRAMGQYFFRLKENERADNCQHCEECEAKCPQNMPISRYMEEVAELFVSTVLA